MMKRFHVSLQFHYMWIRLYKPDISKYLSLFGVLSYCINLHVGKPDISKYLSLVGVLSYCINLHVGKPDISKYLSLVEVLSYCINLRVGKPDISKYLSLVGVLFLRHSRNVCAKHVVYLKHCLVTSDR
jgi:hypothetical protein